ncbi:hypothetical protein [Phenylobacterium sp.]|uniref:hypothetical protein n=1 Tax=Phenylobacterium sp. TaxID=1871053 RepID=UPI002FC67404
MSAWYGDPGLSATEALAEAWASIDGKLDQFHAANQDGREQGYRDGYILDVASMIERLETRGYVIVRS